MKVNSNDNVGSPLGSFRIINITSTVISGLATVLDCYDAGTLRVLFVVMVFYGLRYNLHDHSVH